MTITFSSDILPGQTVYCKLTGKSLIVQKLHYKSNVNPQYVTQERELDKLTVRYLSQKHDEFKSAEVFIYEVSTVKPEPKIK